MRWERLARKGAAAMAVEGNDDSSIQLEELTDAECQSLRLATDGMALQVKHMGEYGKQAAAKKTGFHNSCGLKSPLRCDGDP